jgi:mRNA interferase MazF
VVRVPPDGRVDETRCPLTSNVERLYPSKAYVQLGGERRKATADQMTTASKQRLIRHAGMLSTEVLAAVERVVRVQFEFLSSFA